MDVCPSCGSYYDSGNESQPGCRCGYGHYHWNDEAAPTSYDSKPAVSGSWVNLQFVGFFAIMVVALCGGWLKLAGGKLSGRDLVGFFMALILYGGWSFVQGEKRALENPGVEALSILFLTVLASVLLFVVISFMKEGILSSLTVISLAFIGALSYFDEKKNEEEKDS